MGKTSLFNIITGLSQQTGNYPGVTVDKVSGKSKFANNEVFRVTDLPGTYSLFPNSEDEEIVYQTLIDPNNPSYPDVLVVVLDASNINRNLFLCTQTLDLQIPTVVALNMNDEALKKGLTIDTETLSNDLGVGVITINARTRMGIKALKESVQTAVLPTVKHFNKDKTIATELLNGIKEVHFLTNEFAAYLYAGINKLKIDNSISIAKIQSKEVIARYKLIDAYLKKSVSQKGEDKIVVFNTKLDKVLNSWHLGICDILIVNVLDVSSYILLGGVSNGFNRVRF